MQRTGKQVDFIKYYADPGSETYNDPKQSAIRAGYSKTTASNAASNIIEKCKLRPEIEKYKAKIMEKVDITREMLVKRMADIVFGDEKASNRDITSAASLIGEFMGYKRDNAPNLEKLPGLHEAFTPEQIASLRKVFEGETDKAAKKGLKLSKTG